MTMEKELFTQGIDSSAIKRSKQKRAKETFSHLPLAARIRPLTLDQFYGQEHILGKGKLLRRIIVADRLQSAIFYGPTGSGKTTLGYIIARLTNAHFIQINAVSSNSQELRSIIEQAKKRKQINAHQKTIVFIDEIHRLNKAQQDILMPAVENGDIISMGATTHNPSFVVNSPLLSRSIIFELKHLAEKDIIAILKNALTDADKGLGMFNIQCDPEALQHIAKQSGGDARRALNALEIGALTTEPTTDGTIYFSKGIAEESVQKKIVFYDRDEDYHYDTISAFIKSMRGSDPDASLYWLAKMIYAGEDPRFIARRIVILASEDIGNADPHALSVATSALQALEFVGMPEGRIILAQAVTYLATAPKSNAAYIGIEEALHDVKENPVQEVPTHLRDKSYPGAKRLGRGAGYKYPHMFKDSYIEQEYIPIEQQYYRPTNHGYEKIIQQRLAVLRDKKI